jgi:hypothetical protein
MVNLKKRVKMSEIQKCIADLKSSPLFNLSLASKELFHSNFLAWVLEKKDDQARILLHELTGKKDFVLETLEVTREENNFDLTLMAKDRSGKQCRIVIENKVKSIPSQKQLDEYSNKLAKSAKGLKTIAILLSLTTPEFFVEGDEDYYPKIGPSWRFLGYSDLVKCLDEGKSEDPYHEALLADYRSFVRSLIGLQTGIQDAFDSGLEVLINPFDWPEKKDKSLYSQLKQIRMHDVFEKWRMIALKKELEKAVGSKNSMTLGLKISSGFTNGTGLLEIYPQKTDDRAFLKIQLQGRQLRQVLQKDPPMEKGEVFNRARELLENKQWFLTDDGSALPTCGAKDNGFCKYGDGFVYRYENLNSFTRLTSLVHKLSATSLTDGI